MRGEAYLTAAGCFGTGSLTVAVKVARSCALDVSHLHHLRQVYEETPQAGLAGAKERTNPCQSPRPSLPALKLYIKGAMYISGYTN